MGPIESFKTKTEINCTSWDPGQESLFRFISFKVVCNYLRHNLMCCYVCYMISSEAGIGKRYPVNENLMSFPA